jgi:hypothetical protein
MKPWKIRFRKYTPEEHQKKICEWEGCKKFAMVSGKFKNTKYVRRKKYCSHHNYSNGYRDFEKKNLCENRYGFLGYDCPSGPNGKFRDGQTDVHHINGKHYDDRPENWMELCKCCHSIETQVHDHMRNPEINPHPITGYLKPYRKVA